MKPSTQDNRTTQELFDLHGRVAAVVGGAGYLSQKLAGALAEAGAQVAVLDLDQKKAQEAAAALETRTKSACIGTGVDVTSASSVERALAEVLNRFGQVDILVTAVYGKSPNFYAPFEQFPFEEWEQILRVNLTGAFLCCQIFGRQMVERGTGSIIQIGSVYGVVPPDHRIYENSNLAEVYVGEKSSFTRIASPAAYSVCKAGLVMLTRYLAVYWADKGVRVNSISPGGVFHPSENEEFLQRYSEHVPMGRKAWLHEVNGAVVYLASDASSYVTGHNLVVDGGWTTW